LKKNSWGLLGIKGSKKVIPMSSGQAAPFPRNGKQLRVKNLGLRGKKKVNA